MPKTENGSADSRKGTGRELYLCDPGVNVACRKRSCGHLGRGGCFATDHGAFAKRDESGKPVLWPKKIGSFVQDKGKLTETIVQMNRIREVGIVNAREDLQVIDDALGWLMLLDAMIR